MSTPNVWLNRKQISHIDVKTPTHTGGRVPWYNTQKSRKHKQTFLIGVAGGTASGKTSVCRAIVDHLQLPWVQILSLDCFYRPLTKSERADVANYNFDHPNAFDWDLLLDVLKELKLGKAVECPQYDFTTHSRKPSATLMYGADVVLCEGILMLHNPAILDQFDVKVFVKTDDDIRLIRRIKRDMAERGRTLDSVLTQYQKTVKPSYQLFCEPTQSVADIVIPRGRDNIVAIQLLCDHIKNKLIEGGNINPIFYSPFSTCTDNAIPENVMLPAKDDKLMCSVHELHDNDKDKLDGKKLLECISLLSHELITLCINQFIPRRFFTPSPATNCVPSPKQKACDFEMSLTESPEILFLDSDEDKDDSHALEINNICINGMNSNGSVKEANAVCVVTIFSGGMLFGESIMNVLGNNALFKVNFGSIHIFHESSKPAKPRFYDRKLPSDISTQKVIMVDAFIGTGNRARMALQVIIDHHVPPQNICFISLIASQDGIVNLAKVFPNVQFITASIEHIGSDNDKHWETAPVTSSLVLKYCEAAGIDIVEQECDSLPIANNINK